MKTRLENMLFDSLNVVSNPTRLLTHSQFKPYVEATIDEVGPIGEVMELDSMLMEDEFFQDMLEDINEITENAFDRASTYSDSFTELISTYDENERFLNDSTLADFMEATTDELKEILYTFTEQEEKFRRIKKSENLGMLQVDSTRLDGVIRPSPSSCLKLLHQRLPEMYKTKNEALLSTLTRSEENINIVPKTVHEFTELTEFYGKIMDDLPVIEEEFRFLRDLYVLMTDSSISLGDEVRTRSMMLDATFSRLKNAIANIEDTHDENKQRFTHTLLRQVRSWQPKIQEAVTDITSPVTENVDADIGEVIDYLQGVADNMRVLQREANAYNKQQRVLKVALIDLDEMNNAAKTLDTKLNLWNGIRDWNANVDNWSYLPFSTLNIDKVKEEIHVYWIKVVICEKRLEKSPVVAKFKVGGSKEQRAGRARCVALHYFALRNEKFLILPPVPPHAHRRKPFSSIACACQLLQIFGAAR